MMGHLPGDSVPIDCANGCCLFGLENRRGMCTQCFRQMFPPEAAALEAEEARIEQEAASEEKRAGIIKQWGAGTLNLGGDNFLGGGAYALILAHTSRELVCKIEQTSARLRSVVNEVEPIDFFCRTCSHCQTSCHCCPVIPDLLVFLLGTQEMLYGTRAHSSAHQVLKSQSNHACNCTTVRRAITKADLLPYRKTTGCGACGGASWVPHSSHCRPKGVL